MPSKASRIPFRAHKALLLCSAAWVATAIGMITAQAQVVVPAPDADVVLPNGTLANLRAPDPATTEVTYTGAYTFGVNSGIRLGGVGFGGVAVWSPRAVTLPATGPLQLDTDPATNQPGTFRIGNETAAAALSFGRTWLFLNSPGAQLDLNGHSVAFQWLMTDSGSRIFNNATRQATLTADTAFVSGIGGSLDGNIALVVRGGGGGSFSLLSANTYTGGTLVTGGARVIGGAAGAFGTGDLAIEDGSMVRIQADETIDDGARVTIDAGSTLEVGAWETIGSLAGAGTVLLNGSLVLADSGRSVFSGRFTGNGGFSKTGTGVFVYEGDSTGRSGFMMDLVEGGTFELNGRLGGGNVLLLGSTNRDATLAGVGSTTHRVAVNLFTLDDEVVISPGRGGGRGIGTLTADSFYLTHSGGLGRYLVTLDATGRSDLLYAAGGGSGTQTVIRSSFKVAVDPESTVRANHRYTIVRTIPERAIWAGERFDDHVITSSPYAFVDPVLSYKSDLTEVYLTFAGRGEGGRIVGLADAALTRNQRSVATAIERLPDGDPVLGIVGGARTYEDARRAFDALSGEVNASAISVASNDALEHGAAVLDRLRSTSVTTPQAAASLAAASQAYAADRPGRVGAPALPVAAPRPEYALWGQAFGSRGVLGGDFNAASLDRRTGGLVLGADAGFDRWRVGFAGAWSRSSFDVRSRLSSGEVDTYSGILYGSARFGALALRGGLGYAHHAVDTERTILFPGYSALVGTSREGSSGQAFAEAGYGLMLGSLALEPFAGLAHVSTDLDGFAEAGDAAALVSRGSRQGLTSTSLGLRVAMPIGNLTAKAGVSWRHAFGDDTPTGTFAFASNPGVPFTIAGAPIARDTLALETRLDWALSQSAKIALAYDGQFAQRAQEHRIKAELQVSF